VRSILSRAGARVHIGMEGEQVAARHDRAREHAPVAHAEQHGRPEGHRERGAEDDRERTERFAHEQRDVRAVALARVTSQARQPRVGERLPFGPNGRFRLGIQQQLDADDGGQ
jgi:hypothetical protein